MHATDARTLIRDGYSCTARDATGRRCSAPAHRVVARPAPRGRTDRQSVCDEHAPTTDTPAPLAATPPTSS